MNVFVSVLPSFLLLALVLVMSTLVLCSRVNLCYVHVWTPYAVFVFVRYDQRSFQNKPTLTYSVPSVACSAYRKYHSTKTAVLSVLEGLLTKSDQKLVSITILALLDLCAAFDTLDHAILLRRLESTFGISEVALSWFESYLSDRTQSVVVDGLMSTPVPLVFGVPQGSVLGPVLFTLYSQPLSDVIACHSCDYHKDAEYHL